MEAKFGNFSEMANLLSVKSCVSSDLTVLFERFSLGRLLTAVYASHFVSMLPVYLVKQKWFEKISSPHVRWIKDVYSHSISV